MSSIYVNLDGSGGGSPGPQGPPGEGVAAGGTTGQILIKASSSNYDTYWGDLDVFANYKTHEVDDADPDTYVGQIKATNGAWLIQYISDSGGDLQITYANESNNGTHSTLASAWSNRLSLIYTTIDNLTGI
jgi:hypothetical protein